MQFQKVYESMFQRLVANTAEPESCTACWLWTGGCCPKGYGKLNKRVNGKHTTIRAHREMQQQIDGEYIEIHLDDEDPFGPIILIPAAPLHPDEQTIDHLCLVTKCINPDHFEVIDRVDNSIRGVANR